MREKTDGVYQLFARHDYQSPDADTRTVYPCIVMERIGGQWTIAQIDTSPDRADD